MGKLSSILRSLEGGSVLFWCPGCDQAHAVKVEGEQAWGWNKDVDKPTFSPSVHITCGHYMPDKSQDGACWCKYYAEHPDEERDFSCGSCHSYVKDGMIQFLDDCSHKLAGQTVAIPHYPTGYASMSI